MHVWLQAASLAGNQELALPPPPSVEPSAGSTATVRKASPPTTGRAAAAIAPKPAARAQPVSGGGQTFDMDILLQVSCLPQAPAAAVAQWFPACHGGTADSVLPMRTTSCMQRRAEEQQKEGEGAGVEAGNSGRGGRRVTAAEKKRRAELQVWLRRKPGALATSFQNLPSNCITVETLHDVGLHAAEMILHVCSTG